MKCQICKKREGEYQCSSCGKIICSKCQRKRKGRILCLNCIPKSEKGTKKALYTLVIILIGITIIYLIMENYAPQVAGEYISEELVSLFNTFFLYTIGGIGVLMFLVILFYLYQRRK